MIHVVATPTAPPVRLENWEIALVLIKVELEFVAEERQMEAGFASVTRRRKVVKTCR